MSAITTLKALPLPEKLQLIEDLWDSITSDQLALADHPQVVEKVRSRRACFEEIESLNLFNGLLKKVPVGIYIVCIREGMQMNFEYVSDKWCEIHKIKREDALADISIVHQMIHKDDIENFLKLNEEVARSKKNFLWEGRFIIDGKVLWFRIESAPFNYANEDYRWYGVVQDITESKLTELAIRQSEQNFRTLSNLAKIMICIVSVTNREKFVYVNEEWCRVHEYSKKEARELKPISVLTPESYKRVMDFADKRARGIKVPTGYEITIVTKTGKQKKVDLSSTIVDFNGERVFLTTGLDITEYKKLLREIRENEATLRELNAQKDKFFSIIAHDLKNPFNGILGISELLLEQINEKDYTGIDEYASLIRQSSKSAFELLNNLLEWARAQTGKVVYAPKIFNLSKLIEENIALLKSNADQKDITIGKAMPEGINTFADEQMISTILRNLISNGIKFTHKGGEIRIAVEQTEKEIIISVADNGIGIESERIQDFFRIDKNTSTPGTNNEEGTGLGLILCKEFVGKHNGKIWVESMRGRGSVFYFTLPNQIDKLLVQPGN